jgi:putative endonuclease
MPLRSGKSLGKFGENYACEVIAKKGHKILARNFHSRHGEIDIISEKEGTIYFFEVKTRRTSSLNYPEESITYQKKQRMLKTACEFLGKTSHNPLRFYLFGILLEGQKIKKIECLPIFE